MRIWSANELPDFRWRNIAELPEEAVSDLLNFLI